MLTSSIHDTLRAQLEIALDRVSDGVVLIDATARVLHVNRPAREFLSGGRCSNAFSGTLAFLHPRTQSAFRRALDPEPHDNDDIDSYESQWDRNAWPAPSESDDARREFLVLDDEHVTIARAAVEPLRRASTRETQTYLISLYPQPKDAEVSTQSLRSLYGLSPSEARVAAHVVTVKSVAELANRLALSRNTVKAHLRQIFRKCEVSSFGQLTALVATGPGVRQTSRSPKLSA